jgi:hypothetical protein
MKKKECEFTNNTEAGLAEYQVCNQKNEKKNLEISTKAGATLAQQTLEL